MSWDSKVHNHLSEFWKTDLSNYYIIESKQSEEWWFPVSFELLLL